MAAENPIRRACAEADALTGASGARLHQGRIASPAPFRLAQAEKEPPAAVAERLASTLSLAGTGFSAVAAEGGYLNFTLSEGWFRALPLCWEDAPCPAELDAAVHGDGFPASFVPFDRAFLRLLGARDDPARYTRQDRENPGWLVRYTARRLARFGELSPVPALTAEDKAVLLAAACLPGQAGQSLARGMAALCEAVWAASPQRLAPLAAEGARRALVWGLLELQRQSGT